MIDEVAARELKLFIDNDADLYRQRFTPIIKNLSRKRYNGTYDSSKAITLFMYLVDDGAKKYSSQFGGQFDRETRLETARQLRNDFESEFESGNYSDYKQKYRVNMEKKRQGWHGEPARHRKAARKSNKLKVGDLFQGILITKITDNGNIISGIYSETGKVRTIYYSSDGWLVK